MSTQDRVHAGVPTGGQFAAHDRSEDLVSLREQLRDGQRAELAQSRQNSRISAKILATAILAEYPTAVGMTITEGEDGGYWSIVGTITDEDGNELGTTDEMPSGQELYADIDLPLNLQIDVDELGREAPAPGFDWLFMTPANRHDYATATVDLCLAAAQEL